jgi:general secretion pathway protein G
MTLQNKNKEKGFTLVEIMVVIIIMGILASTVAINVFNHIEEARRTQAKTQIETFKTALKLYRLDNGNYPSNEQGLRALVTKPEVGKLPRKWREGGYIDSIPKDPWGYDYIYQCPGLHGDFDISAYGNDNEPGGEGNDADVNSWEDAQE